MRTSTLSRADVRLVSEYIRIVAPLAANSRVVTDSERTKTMSSRKRGRIDWDNSSLAILEPRFPVPPAIATVGGAIALEVVVSRGFQERSVRW